MHELYDIISIFMTGALVLTCGLILLFTVKPEIPLLSNYRKARYALACAYLFFFLVNVIEYMFSNKSEENIPLLQTITLTIAASQALLFTFVMLSLLEVRFPGWRYILREIIPVILLFIIVFVVYIFCSHEFFAFAFYGFTGLYILLLVRYTRLFLRSYRQFRYRMNNYYSDEQAEHLRWVSFSFFAALTIGIMALFSVIFMSMFGALIFTFVCDIFYTFFAIRFINYAHQFHIIAQAMNTDEIEDTDILTEIKVELTETKKVHLSSMAQNTIDSNLNHWIDGKHFRQNGITIGDVSRHIGTNSKYLSLHINKHMNKTFREWINDLRIEEAKRLLIEYQDMSVKEIANTIGFSSNNYFGKLFLKNTGKTPIVWRKEHLTINNE
ncbi:MAG: helix-turn-helix domain-containing protein [Bacteroidales bacterium]|jgi:AraC-like DNA-binding protein|nr:helix-turn-helix domain-containing protein [Bacteroidales bacterium]